MKTILAPLTEELWGEEHFSSADLYPKGKNPETEKRDKYSNFTTKTHPFD